MSRLPLKIALVGNPNSGKSSLFNALTGLNQKVGNFAGVTVDKKLGSMQYAPGDKAEVLDLPGTYSLYPKAADEWVTYEVLINPKNQDRPQLIIVIADAANLKRNLLFCSQIMDLKIPVVIGLTMMDIARRKGITINVEELERQMGVPVVSINPRRGRGITELKKAISNTVKFRSPTLWIPKLKIPDYKLPEDASALQHSNTPTLPHAHNFIDLSPLTGAWIEDVATIAGVEGHYAALHVACNYTELPFLNAAQRIQIGAVIGEARFSKAKVQGEEIMHRYQRISGIMQGCVDEETIQKKTLRSERLDKTLLHPVWGNVILLTVLFLLFQSIFWLAKYPMDWVESGFAFLGNGLNGILPDNLFRDLLVNGLLAGISGIAVFVPQIAILFGAITILEDTGYMARISFLTDRLMRSVGLTGRSVMPLISGMACAVPAIMAARTIQNRKERLITILVTPLMSCSARLPVYTILIGLVIPSKHLGPFNLQGVVLMGLYMLGFVGALFVSKILSFIIKVKERSFFLMELPVYKAPRWKNVGVTMVEKAKVFVRDAGKVIMVISLLLWALASFGPSGSVERSAAVAERSRSARGTKQEQEHTAQTAKLEHSYAGILGHAIEPAIRPLGFDWKIGIALITSFAAREVFVGTMATLYSVGNDDKNDAPLREKMKDSKRSDGTPVYTLATGLSLLVFYVFAMQCMSTLAVVKRETRSWKWPAIQFVYMLALAWGGAWVVHQLAR